MREPIKITGQIALTSTCPFCGKPNPPIVVAREIGEAFLARTIDPIQVTGGDRDKAEWLISGTCTPCWDRVFKEPEEEEHHEEPNEDPGYDMYQDYGRTE